MAKPLKINGIFPVDWYKRDISFRGNILHGRISPRMTAFFNSLGTSTGQEFLALKAGNVLCLYLVNSFPALLFFTSLLCSSLVACYSTLVSDYESKGRISSPVFPRLSLVTSLPPLVNSCMFPVLSRARHWPRVFVLFSLTTVFLCLSVVICSRVLGPGLRVFPDIFLVTCRPLIILRNAKSVLFLENNCNKKLYFAKIFRLKLPIP